MGTISENETRTDNERLSVFYALFYGSESVSLSLFSFARSSTNDTREKKKEKIPSATKT